MSGEPGELGWLPFIGLPYEQVASRTFATGKKLDPWGDVECDVEFALVGTTIVAVHAYGYYRAGLPGALDEAEATWLLNRYPASRTYKNIQRKEQPGWKNQRKVK